MGCREKGYTEGSFASRAWQKRKTMKYYRVKAGKVSLWEYSGEMTEGNDIAFCFRRLSGGAGEEGACPQYAVRQEDMSSMTGAIACAAWRAAGRSGLFASGVCPEAPERMYAFTTQGLRSFAGTLRAYSKGTKKTPRETGAFAAGKFSESGPDREWVFCLDDSGGPLGRIVGAFGGRYNGSGFYGVYLAYLAVKDEFAKRGLDLSFGGWEGADDGVCVYAKCPGLSASGAVITLYDKGSGKRAFSMQAVSGDPLSRDHFVISRHTLRHTSFVDPATFCRERIPDLIWDVRAWERDGAPTAAA